jgi:hypothetical protein
LQHTILKTVTPEDDNKTVIANKSIETFFKIPFMDGVKVNTICES